MPALIVCVAGLRCASSSALQTVTDAGTVGPGTSDARPDSDSGPGSDAALLPMQHESEPNDGKATDAGTQTGNFTLPGQIEGSLDPADDLDVFSVALNPGELWRWDMVPVRTDVAPHLLVFDTAKNNLNPTVGGRAKSQGFALSVEQFVLRPGSFVVVARDARNVPNAAVPGSVSLHVGGPTYSYVLSGAKKGPLPAAVTFPQTVTGQLKEVTSLALFSFQGTKGFGFDIIVRAKRKAVPSELDSRLSLFNNTLKKAILTNDDAAGTTDSQVGGNLPDDGEYYVILENEAQGEMTYGGSTYDLSYELEFKPR